MTNTAHSVAPADAAPDNWVDRFAPAATRPFLRLMRADRPIGTWLLFIPCLWGAALALGAGHGDLGAALVSVALFGVGAFVMRGAGCTYNDIVDRDVDAQVARTALRPIPAGQATVRAATLFLLAQCLVGLVVLVQFNRFTIVLGASSLLLVAAYPFMKRITWWPQAWLGLTFNWGALVGFAALAGGLAPAAFFLYAAGVAWTLGYDTIYACQDKEDDALVGVKSSARALGSRARPAVAAFYAATVGLAAASLLAIQATPMSLALLAGAAAHFVWQALRFDPDDGARCLALFRSNRDAGLLLLAPLLLEAARAIAYDTAP